MEKPDPLRLLQYTCPVCGAKATIGKHFCEAAPPTAAEAKAPMPIRKILGAAVAVLLIWLLLWQMVGALSLWVLALAALSLAIAWGLRAAARRRRSAGD